MVTSTSEAPRYGFSYKPYDPADAMGWRCEVRYGKYPYIKRCIDRRTFPTKLEGSESAARHYCRKHWPGKTVAEWTGIYKNQSNWYTN